jgi:predicted amidohydrolase
VITDADGYPMVMAEYRTAGRITADVDLAESRIKRFNDNNDVHRDRRTDLYRRAGLLD